MHYKTGHKKLKYLSNMWSSINDRPCQLGRNRPIQITNCFSPACYHIAEPQHHTSRVSFSTIEAISFNRAPSQLRTGHLRYAPLEFTYFCAFWKQRANQPFTGHPNYWLTNHFTVNTVSISCLSFAVKGSPTVLQRHRTKTLPLVDINRQLS